MAFVDKKYGDLVESISLDEAKFLVTAEHIWDVFNFASLTKEKTFDSPTFNGDAKGQNKWSMSFKLSEGAEEPGAFPILMKLGLRLIESESTHPLKTNYQVNVLDAENKVIRPGTTFTDEFVEGRGFIATAGFKIKHCFTLCDTNLRLHCQVSTQTTLKRKRDEEEESSVKRQFRSFFTNGDFADIILKTETTSFPACKVILAAHSPVFSAMFSSDMIESAENIVKIEDFTDEAVKAFLEFMYTGETLVLEENPRDLLKISDKYQVMELKRKAEAVILKSLTIQNAVDILILAHFHSPTTLKPKIIGFVNLNSKDIQQTPAFKEMTGKFPAILYDLYIELSSTEKLKDKP